MVKIEKITANDRRQTARHMKFARVIGRHHARLEPAQVIASASPCKDTAMTPLEALSKISTESGALEFAKLVSSRAIESPLSKAQWIDLIEFQADTNGDPKLSKAQRFSRYIDSEIGKELYFACKAAPGAEVESTEKATSTPMAVISGSSARAYLDRALSLESGRAARMAEAMRLDIVPHNAAGEDNNQGGVANEMRTRAARRHGANPARPYERHASDVLAGACAESPRRGKEQREETLARGCMKVSPATARRRVSISPRDESGKLLAFCGRKGPTPGYSKR
jgi:hypothetical protein